VIGWASIGGGWGGIEPPHADFEYAIHALNRIPFTVWPQGPFTLTRQAKSIGITVRGKPEGIAGNATVGFMEPMQRTHRRLRRNCLDVS